MKIQDLGVGVDMGQMVCSALFPTQAGGVLGSLGSASRDFTTAMDDAEQLQPDTWQQPQGPHVLLPMRLGGSRGEELQSRKPPAFVLLQGMHGRIVCKLRAA